MREQRYLVKVNTPHGPSELHMSGCSKTDIKRIVSRRNPDYAVVSVELKPQRDPSSMPPAPDWSPPRFGIQCALGGMRGIVI